MINGMNEEKKWDLGQILFLYLKLCSSVSKIYIYWKILNWYFFLMFFNYFDILILKIKSKKIYLNIFLNKK